MLVLLRRWKLSAIQNGTVKSFEDLKREYGLENQDFFRYLQLRHRLNEIMTEELSSNILKVFVSTNLEVDGD